MPPSPLCYALLDVFTATPLTGNPLAVFPYAEGLNATTMQAIAQELNLSETIFVGREDDDRRFSVRIFTPHRELPFAGHPVVGTAHWLAARERVDRTRPLILEAPAGALRVRFEDDLAYFTTAAPAELAASSLGRSDAAALFGLEAQEVVADPILASCGLPYHLVPLTSREALSRAAPAASNWARHVLPSGIEQVYVYVEHDGEVSARMFTAGAGVLYEDPATGSAAAALAGHLSACHAATVRCWRIHQGVDMGRPSEILVRPRPDDQGRVRVEVGGRAVIVGEGVLYPGG
ncbi:PhzF family phenazine biosynthesis protein [Halomonas sp. CS7]|uniref:PhzF family phenazine biosynthesis protein n=1 Tax=Halomonas pelophila TaxID=3151122 RepID=A0ABV1N8E5_9GAMM